ncbi:MAG: SAM-dependent methyltransferase [Crocinitomicaceae bacterium]|nr:SAM-dependent methyltransferase [Crocinitomicaceae bacterium]
MGINSGNLSYSESVQSHYFVSELYNNILDKLKTIGVDLNNVKRTDLSSVDEFHVRGLEVSKELAQQITSSNLKVLDVGCGLGGPARMIADEKSCTVTGLDLSQEFIDTAKALSKLVNLDSKTTFLKGDALDLPFERNSFDIVWTQHVQMNIFEKKKFYSEIFRVLKTGGKFLYYDIFKSSDNDINYPMPWASRQDLSHLIKIAELEKILNSIGFNSFSQKNQTNAGLASIKQMLSHIKKFGPPIMGLNVLMGKDTKQKILNAFNHFDQGDLQLWSGFAEK